MKPRPAPNKPRMLSSKEIRRQRLIYSLLGGILGVGLFVSVDWLLGFRFPPFLLVWGALGGSGCGLRYAQEYRGLPSVNPGLMQMREEMGPNDMTNETPIPRALRDEEN